VCLRAASALVGSCSGSWSACCSASAVLRAERAGANCAIPSPERPLPHAEPARPVPATFRSLPRTRASFCNQVGSRSGRRRGPQMAQYRWSSAAAATTSLRRSPSPGCLMAPPNFSWSRLMSMSGHGRDGSWRESRSRPRRSVRGFFPPERSPSSTPQEAHRGRAHARRRAPPRPSNCVFTHFERRRGSPPHRTPLL